MKKLNKKRGTHKAQITNFSKFFDEYKKSERDVIKLILLLDKFKLTFTNFDDISDELELTDSTVDHQSERFKIENLFIDLVAEAEKLKGSSTTNSQNSTAENITHFNQHKRRVKLPEASLPKFNGKYED